MKLVPNAVSVKAARAVLKGRQTSPQTLFVAGMVGMGATIVLACRATLHVEEVLERHEKDSQILEATSVGITNNTAYHNRAMAKAKLELVADLGKLYGPAIVCGALSVSALTSSHNILNKRNAALAAAYGTLEKAYSEYRNRVRAEIGEGRELELYHDVREVETVDENGKKVKVKQAHGGSPYTFLFDEHNANYEQTPEYNFLFLKLQQKYANQRLQARGHLFLNEVLESLGLEHTKAGAVTGWVKGQGDDYVDFGIFEDDMSERVLDFMVGREKAIWLSFNVDGVIYDKI